MWQRMALSRALSDAYGNVATICPINFLRSLPRS